MPEEPRVTLLTRPGCHLCDEARAVVARVAGSAGVGWSERSVAGDAELERRYGEMVPVVLVDGGVHGYWRVDPERLSGALEGSGGPSWLRRRRRTP